MSDKKNTPEHFAKILDDADEKIKIINEKKKILDEKIKKHIPQNKELSRDQLVLKKVIEKKEVENEDSKDRLYFILGIIVATGLVIITMTRETRTQLIESCIVIALCAGMVLAKKR